MLVYCILVYRVEPLPRNLKYTDRTYYMFSRDFILRNMFKKTIK